MSYSRAVPIDESDSRILIEACLARVRKDAGLDAEPVLPPLDVLLGETKPPRPRLLVSPSARQLPTAEAIAKASVRSGAATTAKTDRNDAKTGSMPRRMRWPVVLCGFIAGVFGGAAMMKSPIGQRPAVQHVVKKVQHHVEIAAGAAKSRVVKR